MKPGSHFRATLSLLLAAMLAAAPAAAQSGSAPANDTPPTAASSNLSAEANPAVKPDAGRARKAFAAGKAAEQKGDLGSALKALEEAVRFAPKRADYRTRRDAVRFAVVQQHTDRAERDAVAGRSEEARQELREAVALDPGYRTAQERLQQLERRPLRETDAIPAYSTAPAALQSPPGTRTIDFIGDVRGAYTEIARQFGLRAIFEEDTQTRTIRFRVGEIDFPTAMRLLGQQTKTFWRALDANTFFVINDTPSKRKEYLPFIERTIVLPESERPEQMNEMLRLVREFTGLAHTQLETGTRTITLRGSQPDVALASELVRELEQPRGEIMLEVEILEIDRNASQRLGLTPPSSGKVLSVSKQQILQAQQSTEGLVRLLQQLFGASSSLQGSSAAQIASLLGTGGVSLSSVVPPLIAFGGGKTIFFATLPGAAASFAETLSAVRSARRVLLRAGDGEPATFFVGDRIPLSLAVLSSGSGVGGQGLVPNVHIASFGTGTGPAAVLTTAFRTGGHLDLATANAGLGANTVSILLGNGDGTFGANTDITVGTTPIALVSADFNGDGNADLAVVNQGTNNVSILLGKGDGTFHAPVNFTVGNQPSAIVAGHFTASGHIDLAVANQGSNSVSLLFGDGLGGFQQPAVNVPLTTGTGPVSLATADFDKDGRPDLVTANSTSNTVTVLFGNGAGGFPTQTDFAVGTNPVSVVSADFNGDGDADLAVANSGSNTVSILLGNGTNPTPFPGRTDLTFTSGANPSAVLAADFNNDQHVDLAVADSGADSTTVLFGSGDGTFPTQVSFPTGAHPSALASADFNGDNRADLAIANAGASGNSVTVVVNSSTAILNQGGQLPYPAVQYEDVGLKVKVTPRMHPQNEVTLHLEIEIRSLSPSSFNGIPVISNRSVDQTLRLKINEPSVVSGIFNLDNTKSLSGFPGAADIPGAGYLAGTRHPQDQQTELIIVVTPRLLRSARRLDRARYLGPTGEPAGAAPVETNEPNP